MVRKLFFVLMPVSMLLSAGFAAAGDMSVGNLAELIVKDVLVGIENATVDAQKVVSPRWRKVKLDKETSKAYLNKERGFYWALKESAVSPPSSSAEETRDWRFFFRAIVHYREDGIGRIGMMGREASDKISGLRVRIPDWQNQRPDMLAYKFIDPADISGIAVLPHEQPASDEVAVRTVNLRYVLAGQGHNAIQTPLNWQPYLHGRVRNIFSDGYLLVELTAMAEESHGETYPLSAEGVFYALVPEAETEPW